MADGAITLELDDWLSERLKRGAKAAGMTEAEFARFVLEQHLFNYRDYEWIGDDPATPVDPAEMAAEDGVPWEDVSRWMRSWGKPEELPEPQPLKPRRSDHS